MNDEQPSSADKHEFESERDRKRRSRGERMRKWRKQMRRARSSEYDDAVDLPLPRVHSLYKQE